MVSDRNRPDVNRIVIPTPDELCRKLLGSGRTPDATDRAEKLLRQCEEEMGEPPDLSIFRTCFRQVQRVRSFTLEDCARFGELVARALAQTPTHLRARLALKRTANPFIQSKTSDTLRLKNGYVFAERWSNAKDYGPYILVRMDKHYYDELLAEGWTQLPGKTKNARMAPPCYGELWPARVAVDQHTGLPEEPSNDHQD